MCHRSQVLAQGWLVGVTPHEREAGQDGEASMRRK